MGKTLTQLLDDTGIGRRRMAEMIGRDFSCISNYERKGRMPTRVAAHIAEITGTRAVIEAEGKIVFEEVKIETSVA